MPASPWARVSWISRAIRCRSSCTPASRACTSSWACSPAFSASAASSLPFASCSSASARFCLWLRRSSSSAKRKNAPASTIVTSDSTSHSFTVAADRPPVEDAAWIIAVAATPAYRQRPFRNRNAWTYPMKVKMPYQGASATTLAPSTISPT